MANGGIIGPTNPVGKIAQPKTTIFIANGTLSTTACTTKVDVTLVAGGGAGGSSLSTCIAGGGGAGGYRTITCVAVCASSPYPITIGAGGATNTNPATNVSGNPSIAVLGGVTYTSCAGGGGGTNLAGSPGGSGGGSEVNRPSGKGCGTACQGNDGGDGPTGQAGGGGGGAGAAGQDGQPGTGGYGGVGACVESYVTQGGALGAACKLAAGGGGGTNNTPGNPGGAGGAGGGGQGGPSTNPAPGISSGGLEGFALTGSGGGGGGYTPGSPGAAGGSGVAIIKEKGSATSVSGMWSMQDQYDAALTGCWSFASPFGEVNVLVIAGGGGGGGSGGGAGGYQFNTALTLGTGVTYPVVVGGGGTGYPGNYPTTGGTCGVDSTFGGPDIQTITATGGGRGANPGSGGSSAYTGGSGGGGKNNPAPGPVCGAAGDTPALFMTQGNRGGAGTISDNCGVGGGGGAGAAAVDVGCQGAGVGGVGGAGGAGSNAWPGDSTLRAGGGGGRGGYPDPYTRCSPSFPSKGGLGGPGGGGNGVSGHDPAPQPVPLSKTLGYPGTANTGGGGGGGGTNPQPFPDASEGGGAGGPGVVIIQYPGGPAATGGTITPIPGCRTQHEFTATGCFVT